ncbi:DNA polymerase III subunit gamma/tau [Brevibacillus sp. FSL K6-0770]|jgi:DNA polymerase-3 subunit gamma/tau|uniref:DNA-directed DNA polymerase n=1 Tax=Brevibacillus parabrevis TaxID=54914 RepID=A0A4Y3PMB4_BREPA|nr:MULTISPECIES: DNA polymerase III subunit gamma/tau [Brevibacillus]MDH6353075.1 DNA polymerase-3 subunit gamma/tau [Brevibacillus sp. 1238]MED2256964.1 DNA polymerase III subunit gamma/tau [Brevibacillus parabrevis]NRQ56556.1 DNA polymerase III subunit gamma/tau [Brevibacillus sp. HD1.4A]RNB93278.1 DNA polymerase III subunit gamma/tau [Brevibacillus parabrevis]GEB33985.1 DNA polymerase III subunit gamma/tau [Brevibacillus parabrevis]
MAYTALYRVYRPQTFQDVVGQEHVTITLRNALRENRLSHAYLFNGPRGTGKTSAAKIMAKAVNCEQPIDGEPCNQCDTCKAISNGSVTDVLEIDAASNRGVEEIRDIRDKVKFAPSDVRYKVYIIDEVHMLTTEAFNALLKTLEEPPSHVIFILATTEPHKLPATIISRCQRFDFHRIPLKVMVDLLQRICQSQGVQVEEQALQLVAKMAEGGARDALSLLDQAISYSKDEVRASDIMQITGTVAQSYFSVLARHIAENDVAQVMEQFDRVMVQGKDPEQFLHDFLYYYRDMLLLKTAPQLEEIVERTMIDDQFQEVAKLYSLPALYAAIETCNQSLSQLKWSTYARVLVELTLVKMCQSSAASSPNTQTTAGGGGAAAASSEEWTAMAARLNALEERLSQVLQGQISLPGQQKTEEPRKSEPRRVVAAAAGGGSRTSMNRVREVAKALDENLTRQVRGQWSQILNELKKVKIQYQAWLVNGQPVAAGNDAVIVTFTSAIHCDKTMEPELKGVVERVMSTVLGRPLQLLSVMEEEWQSVDQQTAQKDDPGGEQEDPFLAEAIKLVGEGLIEVKD